MKKRIFAIILSLALIIGMLPAAVAAANGIYSDVSDDAWYADEVRYVTENGLMNGVGGDMFAPDTYVTRGMLVTILYRMNGSPEVDSDISFIDVEPDEWYAEAVRWAAANNIVNGYDDGTFKPNADICREETATILYRYVDYLGLSTETENLLGSYPDADKISDWAYDGFKFANAAGLITGMDTGMLAPREGTTRAQTAVIIYRLCGFIEEMTPVETFTVTFDYNYSDMGTYTTVDVNGGETVDAPEAPERGGYDFAGWYISAIGGIEFDFDTPITEDVTLYAKWERGTDIGDIILHFHNYKEVNRVEPTCTTDGYIVYECSCGDSYRETIPASGAHSWSSWTNNDADNHVRHCTVCNATENEPHNFELSTVYVDNVPFTTKTCTVCGAVVEDQPLPDDIVAQTDSTHYYTSLELAIEKVEAGGTVTLRGDIERAANESIVIDKDLTIDGGDYGVIIKATGNWETGSAHNSDKHLISVVGDVTVTIKNVVVECNNASCGIQAYDGADLTIDSIQILNSVNAGLIVNGATVTANDLYILGCKWGCVNVDKGSGVTEDSVFTLTGEGSSLFAEINTPQIWSENRDVTVNAEGYASASVDIGDKTWTYWMKDHGTGFITVDANNKVHVILTPDGLYNFGAEVNYGNTYDGEYVLLACDITYDENSSGTIGSETKPFKGTFDGNGHSINNLNVGESTFIEYSGLFGYVDGGTVKNVVINDADIYGLSYAGGIAGYAEDATFSNNVVNGLTITLNNQDSTNNAFGANAIVGGGKNNTMTGSTGIADSITVTIDTLVSEESLSVLANADTKVLNIEVVGGFVSIDSSLNFVRTKDSPIQLNINGGGNSIIVNSGSFDDKNGKHMLTIGSNIQTTISNITFENISKAYGIQAYENDSVVLENVTITGSLGAGLTVNGSNVTASGLTIENCAWGCVNVDPGDRVTSASAFTLISGELNANDYTAQIWSDGHYVIGDATVTVNADGYNSIYVNTGKGYYDASGNHVAEGNSHVRVWTNTPIQP